MVNDTPSGIIPIYKPSGPTSHDIIAQLRRVTGEQRIGHAGTLDPLASGVLVVGIGREATKRLQEFQDTEKEYHAVIRLGATSTTDDSQGEITPRSVETPPTRQEIERILPRFIGTIQQAPPQHSAVHYQGKRAHQRARAGERMNLGTRTVTIHSVDIIVYQYPELSIRVVCESGVYIRSLARDIGEQLGTGGYITALQRTRVGEYTCASCRRIEEIQH